jgi:hypothetical protein
VPKRAAGVTAVPGELPPNIQTVGEANFPKLMLYSMWGVGKTVYVGSAGPRSLILRPPTDHTDSIIAHYPKELRPKEWVIHDWDEMDAAGEYLRLHGHEWDWVTLDSISLWQDTGLDDIWAAVIERNPARNAKHAGMDKGEYGRNMDRIAAWVRQVVSQDTFNFCITAHPTNRLESPTGDVKMMPWVQGKGMSEKICGYMTMVGYMEKKKSPTSGREFRQITFTETDDFYAKDQYAAFPNSRLIDPTVPKLTAAIAAAKARTTTASAPGGGKKKGART